jgi:hypothetical protein
VLGHGRYKFLNDFSQETKAVEASVGLAACKPGVPNPSVKRPLTGVRKQRHVESESDGVVLL